MTALTALLQSRRTQTVLALGAIAYLAIASVLAVATGASLGIDFAGYAADGPFQLYDPLHRMAQGQVPGRDFPFFHGVGVIELHYPLFQLLGGNLLASEITRWVVSAVCFYGSGYLACYAALRNWRRAFIALAVYASLVIPLDRMIDPSNSLLGVRSTLPILVGVALIWRIPRLRTSIGPLKLDLSILPAALLAGASISFGTEQGLACCAAFVITRLVQTWLAERAVLVTLLRSGIEAVVAAVAVVAWSSLLTLGHAAETLRYALVDIPADQGWQFGSPPNAPFTWGSLIAQLTDLNSRPPIAQYSLLAALAAVVAIVAVRTGRLRRDAGPAVLLWLLGSAGAAAGVIGYVFLVDQLAPFARSGALVLAIATTALVLAPGVPSAPGALDAPPASARRRVLERARTVIVPVTAAALVIAVAAGALWQGVALKRLPLGRTISALPTAFGAPNEKLLGVGFADGVAEFEPYLGDGVTTWSTYTSIYDAVRGTTNPAPGGEDYIIHAVGDERRAAYQKAFADQKPDVAITMRPSYFGYEEWLWSKYPQFYRELLLDYTLRTSNGTHFLWQRSGGGSLGAARDVRDDATTISLPANDTDAVQLWSVRVGYSARANFPVGSNLPRYLLTPDGTGLSTAIALPPTHYSWELIVPVMPGQTAPRLTASTIGVLPDARLTIDSASARQLTPASASDLQLFEQNACVVEKGAAAC